MKMISDLIQYFMTGAQGYLSAGSYDTVVASLWIILPTLIVIAVLGAFAWLLKGVFRK